MKTKNMTFDQRISLIYNKSMKSTKVDNKILIDVYPYLLDLVNVLKKHKDCEEYRVYNALLKFIEGRRLDLKKTIDWLSNLNDIECKEKI